MESINKLAALGAGVMGGSISAHLFNAGLKVLLLDRVLNDEIELRLGQKLSKNQEGWRNRLAEQALQKGFQSQPTAFYVPERSKLIEFGNFSDDLNKIIDCD